MVAISSRSVVESERVVRPRMVGTNFVSAAAAAGSGWSRTGRPGSGLLGRRQRPDDLILGHIVVGRRRRCDAEESAAAIVTIERIAARFLLPCIFDIASLLLKK